MRVVPYNLFISYILRYKNDINIQPILGFFIGWLRHVWPRGGFLSGGVIPLRPGSIFVLLVYAWRRFVSANVVDFGVPHSRDVAPSARFRRHIPSAHDLSALSPLFLSSHCRGDRRGGRIDRKVV